MSDDGLQAILATPLLQGAEALALTGSSSLRLDASAAIWLVDSGQIELFAVEERGPGASPGARSHLATATAGHLLFGLAATDGAAGAGVKAGRREPGAEVDGGVGLLAVAAPSGRLLRLHPAAPPRPPPAPAPRRPPRTAL